MAESTEVEVPSPLKMFRMGLAKVESPTLLSMNLQTPGERMAESTEVELPSPLKMFPMSLDRRMVRSTKVESPTSLTAPRLSRTVMAPVDLVKVRLQAESITKAVAQCGQLQKMSTKRTAPADSFKVCQPSGLDRSYTKDQFFCIDSV